VKNLISQLHEFNEDAETDLDLEKDQPSTERLWIRHPVLRLKNNARRRERLSSNDWRIYYD
jgi:hypothetical protein